MHENGLNPKPEEQYGGNKWRVHQQSAEKITHTAWGHVRNVLGSMRKNHDPEAKREHGQEKCRDDLD